MSEPALIEVTLDGETRTLAALPGQLVIEAMEDAGMHPPHSCRAGCCAACMCKLVEGEVEMISNSVLDEDEIGQGWILACQSVALTPRLKIQYPD